MTSGVASTSATLRISHKSAAKFCKVINRKKLAEAKKVLDKISKGDVSIEGRTYNSIAEEIAKMLNQLESNARKKNLDSDNMFVFASTHRGPTMYRNRRRWRKFGARLKSCHIQLVLSEKKSFAKKQVKEKKLTDGKKSE